MGQTNSERIRSRCALVRELFEENFGSHGELGASVSVYLHGEEILSLAGGYRDRQETQPWTRDTAVLLWSATKGPAAACVLHLCEKKGIALSSTVASHWPEFAAADKATVTLAQILSHQAGLAALSQRVPVLDHAAVAAALAQEPPNWPPGTAHGYHPRTFGFLLDEIVRRISGDISLGQYWRENFAQPLGLDFWIGADPAQDVAPIFPARGGPPKGDDFYTAFLTANSLTARAFASPHGLHSIAGMNTPEARTASLPAFGGIGTASALAKLYAMLAQGGTWDGRTYFETSTLAQMSRTLSQGRDLILQIDSAFSAGFMRDPIGPDGAKKRHTFGASASAFGHPGAGGSHGFADPEQGLSFAYVMNQMETGVLPNPKSLRLVEALYS